VKAVSIAVLLACFGPSCAPDPIPGGREQIVDGRFARWPGAGAVEGDAWRSHGGAGLDAVAGELRVRAPAGGPAGAEILVPVSPGSGHQLSLRHRGGSGRLEVTVDDEGTILAADLPAAADWTRIEASIVPARDGVRVRLLDDGGDGHALRLAGASLARPAVGEVQYEPPIQLLLVVHAATDVGNADRYWQRRDALAEMAEAAEQHGLCLTMMLSGPYAEWAWSLGDHALYADLQDRGHEVGTYVFPLYRAGHLAWEGGDIFDPGMADTQWADHRAMVDQLVPADTNRTVCAYAPMADMAALMQRHGFTLDLSSVAVNEPGGRSRESVAWDYLGHYPHHPYRPADMAVEGEELAADPSTSYVTLGHAAQIGRSEAHGAPCQLADYERILGLLLDRWTAHQRAPAGEIDDLPWVFGAIHSPNQHEQFGEDFHAWLDHLDEVALGQATPEGNVVAEGATAAEVLAAFQRWEYDHPDQTPFSFTLPP